MTRVMKNEEEIHEEIQKNVDIIGGFIKKQKENISLSDIENRIREQACIRIITLLWVLGEYDGI